MDNTTDNKYQTKRFFEIDFIKGIATIFMIIFHFFYLMYFMNIKKFNIDNGILNFFARSAHSIFILMVGVNIAISYKKIKEKYKEFNNDEFMNIYIGKTFKRAMYLLLFGFIMTLLSYLGFGNLFIKFGIFHFIGISLLLSILVTPYKYNPMIATGIILVLYSLINYSKINNVLSTSCENMPLFCFISGLYNVKYSSLDYFPIIPFFGLMTLGITIGNYMYTDKKRNYLNEDESKSLETLLDNNIVKNLTCVGSNSFKI